MVLGRWQFNAEDEETLEAFRHYFTTPPLDQRGDAFGKDRNFGRIFNRPGNQGVERGRMKIRTNLLRHPDKKSGRVIQAPLCAGCLCQHRMHEHGGARFYRADLLLSLNLLRFIRHQPEDEKRPINRTTRSGVRFLNRGVRNSFEGEFSLDQEDNWLPDSKGWRAYATPKQKRAQLEIYLNTVSRKLEREAAHAMNVQQVGQMFISRTDHFSISEVETVWEFASENPYDDVLHLGEILIRHCAGDPRARLYQKGEGLQQVATADRVLNSLSVLVPVAEKVQLRLYAKTNKRIRIEVVQVELEDDIKKLRKEAGLKPLPPFQKGVMQERKFSEMMPVFAAIRKRAASHLNEFFHRIAIQEGGGEREKSGLELLAEISSAVATVEDETERVRLMRRLMSLIAQQGGYRGGAKMGNLGKAIAVLSRRGVLQHWKGKRLYAVTPAYGPAAASLRALSAETLKALFGEVVSDSRWDIRYRTGP